MNVFLLTFQTSIVPTILRLGLFAFGPFQAFLTIFDRSKFHERSKKRSETVEMQTDPNSERSETPRTKSGKLLRHKVFSLENYFKKI
jgi:hypothetical protein